MYIHVWALGVYFSHSLLYCLETESLNELEACHFKLDWLASELLGSSCLCPSNLSLRVHTPSYSHGCWGLECRFSRLHGECSHPLSGFFSFVLFHVFHKKLWREEFTESQRHIINNKWISSKICLLGVTMHCPLIKVNGLPVPLITDPLFWKRLLSFLL